MSLQRMSLQNQLMRGLFALPISALLIVAGVSAPAESGLPSDDCATASVVTPAPRTVDFHSMLPGALNVLPRKVKMVPM